MRRAPVHQSVDLVRGPHHPLGQALDEHAALLILADVQVDPLGLEKVADDLVVYLHVGSADQVLAPGARVRFDAVEDVLDGARNDTPLGAAVVPDRGQVAGEDAYGGVAVPRARVSLHGERLAGARLAVGEHRGVVPGERGQHRVLGAALVHTLLAGVLVVDVIEGELVRVVEDAVGSDRSRSAPPRLEVLADGARAVPLVDVDGVLVPLAAGHLALERRSDADDNLEVLVLPVVRRRGHRSRGRGGTLVNGIAAAGTPHAAPRRLIRALDEVIGQARCAIRRLPAADVLSAAHTPARSSHRCSAEVVSRTANGEKSAHDSTQGWDGGLARKTRSAVSD